MPLSRLSSKGQLVIPIGIRKKLGLEQGGELSLHLRGRKIVLEPIAGRRGTHTWESWRGALRNSTALEDHLKEHSSEVAQDEKGF